MGSVDRERRIAELEKRVKALESPGGKKCRATFESKGGGVTFYCTLQQGHEGDHYHDGPLTWWFDDSVPTITP